MSAIICSEVFTTGIGSWMSGPDRISPADSSSASSHSPSSDTSAHTTTYILPHPPVSRNGVTP